MRSLYRVTLEMPEIDSTGQRAPIQPRPWRFDVQTGCVTHARESRCVLPRARHATSKPIKAAGYEAGTYTREFDVIPAKGAPYWPSIT
jgi:hypothetical protein